MRIRARFSKLGKIRWTSHRDVARMWERAFRRERLPLAYTEGFSPRPKVSFGLALPTGHESLAEYLDFEVVEDGAPDPEAIGAPADRPDSLAARLSGALPSGVDVLATGVVAPGSGSLQEQVTSCTWRIGFGPTEGGRLAGPTEIGERVAALLAAPEAVITRTRKGTETREDVRPGIIDLRVEAPAGGGPEPDVWLSAELATQPRGLRPAELLAALGPDLVETRARRLNQWISRDGARWEPLGLEETAAATGAPHALGRAS